jgi:hypothetical protein
LSFPLREPTGSARTLTQCVKVLHDGHVKYVLKVSSFA